MGNELDEITGPTNSAGRDINVVDKQLNIEVGFGSPTRSLRHFCQ